MVAGSLLSRVLGLLRDTFFSAAFGLGVVNDSYQIATRIPDFIYLLIAGGGLSSAFIPVFADYWHKNKREEAWRVFSVVTTLTTIIASVLVLIAWIFTPQMVHSIGHGKPPEAFPTAILISRIMLPAQVAFLVGSVLLGTLYARKSFLAPSLAPNIYNVGIIIGAAVLPHLMGLGVEGVAWGAVVGAYLGNIVIPSLSMAKIGSKFKPSLDIHVPGVGQFFKLLLPVILGFSLPSMVGIVGQYYASPYGVGANTALNYAGNLMLAPNGIFGQSLALAVFPVLSQFVAQNRMDLYRKQLSTTLRTVLFLSIPSSVLMFVLAPQIVDVIYGYGKGHDPKALAVIAGCLQIYSIGVFAWCVQPVLMRGFFSMHKTFLPVAIGTAMTLLFIVECYAIQGNPLGIQGICWATNVAAILLIIILYWALEKNTGKLNRRGLVVTSVKTLIASAVMIPVAAGGGLVIQSGHRRFIEICGIITVSLAAAWAFYLAARLMKMPETAYFDRAVAKLSRRRG